MVTRALRVVASLSLQQLAFAQQAPFYDTPKFDRSVNHRHNFCQQHRRVFNESIAVKDALRGLKLSVVFGSSNEYNFALDARGRLLEDGYPGLYVVLMDELAERAGFNWRNSFGVATSLDASTDGNKTWTDYLEWRVDTYDLSASRWSRTFLRMNRGISFPEGWYDSSIILVERDVSKPTAFDVWNFLKPFHPFVWILIVVSIIATGVLYWVLERLDSNADARNLIENPSGAIFLSAITFTQHFEFRPNTNSARIIAFSWTFWALITAAAYTANLASFLVSRNHDMKVASLDQAVRWNLPICVHRLSSTDQYMTDKYPNANVIRKEVVKDAFDGLLTGESGECDVLVTEKFTYDQYERRSDTNGACDLKWYGRTERIVSGGFATAMDTGTYCTSLVSNVLDLYLIEMKSDGFIEKAWKDFLDVATDHQCQVTDTSQDSASNNDGMVGLTIKEMGGIFVFHYILCAIAFALAFVGYCRTKRLKKRHSKLDLHDDTDDVCNSQDQNDQCPDSGCISPARPSIKRRRAAATSARQSMWNSDHPSLANLGINDDDFSARNLWTKPSKPPAQPRIGGMRNSAPAANPRWDEDTQREESCGVGSGIEAASKENSA